MTPERREYLHSISNEEIYVRFALSTVKNKLSIAKLNKSLGYLGETDTEIQDYKTIIKVLKKELPAPSEYFYLYEGKSCIGCSVCGCHTQPYFNYCCKCGKKLR